jgi:hypothetical protein
MGSNTAYDLANSNLSIEQNIAYHLRSNHYPPVPLSMVQPCIDAIDAYWEDDLDREIPMPEGVSFKNKDTAPARAIIQQFHLDAWVSDDEE